MTGSVQRVTVAAPRTNEMSKSYKSVLDLSYQHFKCLDSGSQNCDEGSMLRGRGAILDEARHIVILLFHIRASDIYLSESVHIFVCNSRPVPPSSPPVVVTRGEDIPGEWRFRLKMNLS